jgi:glucose-1-phosphate thymidylyltransferase
LCRKFVGDDTFVVHLGDDLLKGGIRKFVKEFQKSDIEAMVLLCKVRHPQRFGVAEFDANGRLARLVEKPKDPPSDYAMSGIYFFKPTIFDMIEKLKPSWRGELEITEAIQLLLDRGNEVGHRFVEGWWKDTGTPEDVLESNRLILDEAELDLKGIIEDEASIQGRISLGEKSVIRRGAIVRGPTTIGRNTVVEAKVYIGPYTSIGNNVVVRKGEIENSIIMDNCHIEIEGKITDSLVGPHSAIISDHEEKPEGYRFIIGERSRIKM